jgi:hypothetical protein
MQLLHEVVLRNLLEVPEDNGTASAVLQGREFFR